jgi:IS30 family transposase
MPVIEIARRLKKHRSTIYRELARNTCGWGYLAEDAQQRTDVRRWVNHRVRKMDDPAIKKKKRGQVGCVENHEC